MEKFKQLKQENDSIPLFDKFDFTSFHELFFSLYHKPCQQPDLTKHSQNDYRTAPDLGIINDPITRDELLKAICKVKKDNSNRVGQQLIYNTISNEMLQNLITYA